MKVFSDRGAHWYTTQGEGVIEIHIESLYTAISKGSDSSNLP